MVVPSVIEHLYLPNKLHPDPMVLQLLPLDVYLYLNNKVSPTTVIIAGCTLNVETVKGHTMTAMIDHVHQYQHVIMLLYQHYSNARGLTQKRSNICILADYDIISNFLHATVL